MADVSGAGWLRCDVKQESIASVGHMTKRRLIAVLVILGVILGAVAFSLQRSKAPSYQGKGINAWLRELTSAYGQADLQKRHEAEQAFRMVGEQAVPYIVASLRKSDSPWTGYYRTIWGRLPARLQRLLPIPTEEIPSQVGEGALFAIGEPAKPALIVLLKDHDPLIREVSARTLGALAHYTGTDLQGAKAALIHCLRDPDTGVRWFAAYDLGYLGSDAVTAVPSLIPLLKDPETGRQKGQKFSVRAAAARTLGKVGPPAETGLPALRAALEDPEPFNRGVAAIATWRIDPKATNTLPVLIEALSLITSGQQHELFEGLGEMGAAMGADAREAFPVLLKLLTEARPVSLQLSPLTLQKITNALIRIDAGAAARAGVQRAATNESRPSS
jgi:HEAT repeat protein